MDSFVTCPGLGTLPETRHVIRETLRAGPVVDDSSAALALRQSPVDNELAERASLRLHVSVTIAGDIAPSATVEDLSSSVRAPNLCRCQATLRKSQQNTAMVCITALNIVYLTI